MEAQEKILNLLDAIKIYKKSMQADKKSINTITNYTSTLNDFIKYCYKRENIDISNIKESDFKVLVHEYLISKTDYANEKLEKKVEYKASSLNSKRCCLRNFIKKLQILGKIDNDFSSSIENLKTETGGRKRVLSRDELGRVNKLLNEDIEKADKWQIFLKIRNKYLLWFFVLTGVRVSELVKVKWEDIDKDNNEILIRKAKGKKTRVVDMLKELKLMLYEYEDHLKKIKEFGYDIESPYVFTKYRNSHKPMDNKTAYHVITDIMKRAGINNDDTEKNISPHNLRHTFVSYGIDQNVNPAYLARQVGHSSPDVLYKVYTHEIDQKQREEERTKMEQAFVAITK